ncbi:MAG: histidine phosphatase family protein [Verrucomicrobia bacterium]|nr:histidine phosphatase family protein [Verrucomicrobiota bacterium]
MIVPAETEAIILIVRHGETDINAAGILGGCRTNVPLNAQGHDQARRVAALIASLQKEGKLFISSLHSSDLIRAVETAGYFSTELNLPIEQHPDLREIDWGDAEGHPFTFRHQNWGPEEARITEQFPERTHRWDYLPAIPNAEKYSALLQRTTENLRKIAEANLGKTVLVVSHGRVIKTLIGHLLDLEEKQIPYPQNCGITIVRYSLNGSFQFLEIQNL